MTVEFVRRPAPARRVAAVRGHTGERDQLIDVVPPMFGALAASIAATGACPDIGVAQYDMTEDGMDILVAYDYVGAPAEGFEVVELPALPDAVCGVHLGPMSNVHQTWQQLMQWIEEHGLQPIGACREVHLEAGDGSPDDDQSDWVTELQQPVRPIGR